MRKTERKDGYYWVRISPQTGWMIARYIKPNNLWTIFGISSYFLGEAFCKIGPRIPEYKPKTKKKHGSVRG